MNKEPNQLTAGWKSFCGDVQAASDQHLNGLGLCDVIGWSVRRSQTGRNHWTLFIIALRWKIPSALYGFGKVFIGR